jgi:hypothetical protein
MKLSSVGNSVVVNMVEMKDILVYLSYCLVLCLLEVYVILKGISRFMVCCVN